MSYPALPVGASLQPPLERPRRPWQVMVVGPGLHALSRDTVQRLAEILDRLPDVPFLTANTEAGEAQVSRDFPAHTIPVVDGLLVSAFAEQPELLGVTFPVRPGQAKAHTATPEAPYSSALSQRWAQIQAACDRGDLSEAEALQQLRAAAAEN